MVVKGVGVLNSPILLKMNNIHKKFPGVYALNDVSFDLKAGEVHALLGENGAGKSTLIKILGGIYKMNSGSIEVNGHHLNIDSVSDARDSGISIIHQELVLVPHLNVYENIFLGRETRKKNHCLDCRTMNDNCQRILDMLGVTFSPKEIVANLNIAQQQMVEIAKAISFNSKIIVMDEPTSSLSDKDVESLFKCISSLKKQGIGIIYISHRMSELQQIADRVTVMRDGKYVATKEVARTSNDDLIALMVGRDIGNYYVRTHNQQSQEIILEVEHLTSNKVSDINFQLKKSEILGFGGLVGCGRTETMRALFGIDKTSEGVIKLGNQTFDKKHNPSQMIDAGFALVPENRRDEGLYPIKSSQFNMTLKVLKQFIKGISLDSNKENEIFGKFKKDLSIKVPLNTTPINSLSGGNQQKVIIASWLATNPKVLILDEPTRGIDVGAKSEIYQIMNELTEKGVSIIMISSELPELINMSDRVAVMCDGKITAMLEGEDISQENIMKHAVRY
ncbi:MAG: sugar ABC transporter ATP-binding protein [Sphaerochaetaceae bacterium]|nr:sugar ABC transporter ATP-binding protein [Sphaerochaetaceae bacterium]